MAKIITIDVQEDGYTVEVIDATAGETIESYSAGNHPGESQTWIDPAAPHALSRETLTQYANVTAEEMSKEHNAPIVEE